MTESEIEQELITLVGQKKAEGCSDNQIIACFQSHGATISFSEGYLMATKDEWKKFLISRDEILNNLRALQLVEAAAESIELRTRHNTSFAPTTEKKNPPSVNKATGIRSDMPRGPEIWIGGLVVSVLVLVGSLAALSPILMVISFVGAVVCAFSAAPHFETKDRYRRTYSVWLPTVIKGHTGCGAVLGIIFITLGVILAFGAPALGVVVGLVGIVLILSNGD